MKGERTTMLVFMMEEKVRCVISKILIVEEGLLVDGGESYGWGAGAGARVGVGVSVNTYTKASADSMAPFRTAAAAGSSK